MASKETRLIVRYGNRWWGGGHCRVGSHWRGGATAFLRWIWAGRAETRARPGCSIPRRREGWDHWRFISSLQTNMLQCWHVCLQCLLMACKHADMVNFSHKSCKLVDMHVCMVKAFIRTCIKPLVGGRSCTTGWDLTGEGKGLILGGGRRPF